MYSCKCSQLRNEIPTFFIYLKLDKGTSFGWSLLVETNIRRTPQDITIEQGWNDWKWRNIKISEQLFTDQVKAVVVLFDSKGVRGITL